MKVLITLAILCLLQSITGQATEEPGQQVNQAPTPDAGHKQQDENKYANAQQQQVEQQPVTSKVSIEIPPKVQQVVTEVSQQMPQVEGKDRVVRSVKNRVGWQAMQVNAVEQPGKCEYICNPLDTTVCGYNERCYWEFESQCDLNTYNCLNTQKIFHVVDFAKCQDIGEAKCYRGDM